ncbi:Uncharacterized protein FWK35_00008322 [Aphis craccivora]|uniref:Uncharacterized protein n=1 Tax=Aphis craccivora TaxID=307492 RepID=A0A6G0ZIR6_APHCR|nr:Uncharacterized protein FWK35_00008322 [Aphis craccivora]
MQNQLHNQTNSEYAIFLIWIPNLITNQYLIKMEGGSFVYANSCTSLTIIHIISELRTFEMGSPVTGTSNILSEALHPDNIKYIFCFIRSSSRYNCEEDIIMFHMHELDIYKVEKKKEQPDTIFKGRAVAMNDLKLRDFNI